MRDSHGKAQFIVFQRVATRKNLLRGWRGMVELPHDASAIEKAGQQMAIRYAPERLESADADFASQGIRGFRVGDFPPVRRQGKAIGADAGGG